ncbi:hypothetical protein RYX36_015073, partial [Vicia faba]
THVSIALYGRDTQCNSMNTTTVGRAHIFQKLWFYNFSRSRSKCYCRQSLKKFKLLREDGIIKHVMNFQWLPKEVNCLSSVVVATKLKHKYS